MRHRISVFGLVLIASLSSIALAQKSGAPADTEKARIERLAGLAKVWGEVKFFHPYLAYREIDWDKALVETIPRVNVAQNGQ